MTLAVNHVRDEWRDDDSLPALIDARDAVERLKAHPGWKAVQIILTREIATIDRELDEGRPKEAAEYAQAHGRRSALRAADEAARAIIQVATQREQQAIERVQAESGAKENV